MYITRVIPAPVTSVWFGTAVQSHHIDSTETIQDTGEGGARVGTRVQVFERFEPEDARAGYMPYSKGLSDRNRLAGGSQLISKFLREIEPTVSQFLNVHAFRK